MYNIVSKFCCCGDFVLFPPGGSGPSELGSPWKGYSCRWAFLLSPAGIWGPVMPSSLRLPASGMRLGSGAKEA